MTNYLRMLIGATALCAVACSAGESPAKPAAPAAKPASPPAAAAAAPAAARYSSHGSGGTLRFSFIQADAANTGDFTKFSTELDWNDRTQAPVKLDVIVQVASAQTQDKDRDDALRSADLLNVEKFPTARYSATSFTKGAGGEFVANGKLTLRGVTRDLKLPLRIQAAANGLALSGEVSIRRLDYGVGQGDYKSTEWVGDEVKLQYKVPLAKN